MKSLSSAYVLLAFFGATALRAETQKTFDVDAKIVTGCAVDGVGMSGNAGHLGELDFGADVAFSTATHTASLEAAPAIRLRCTTGTVLKVQLGGGQNPASNKRRMKRTGSASDAIEYRLYSNSAMTSEIAIDGQINVPVVSADSQDVKIPIYGKTTLPGTVGPGVYTDIIQVTLTW